VRINDSRLKSTQGFLITIVYLIHFSARMSYLTLFLSNSVAVVRKRTIPTELPPLVGEVIANIFADRRCLVVSATDPLLA
jgi:hypothetical protein